MVTKKSDATKSPGKPAIAKSVAVKSAAVKKAPVTKAPIPTGWLWSSSFAAALARIQRERGKYFDARPATAAELSALAAVAPFAPGLVAFHALVGGARTLERSFNYFGDLRFLPARVLLRERDAAPGDRWPDGAITLASTMRSEDTCGGWRFALCPDGRVREWHERSGVIRDPLDSFDAMLADFTGALARGAVSYDDTYGFSL